MIAHAMACTDIVLKCVTIEFLSVHVITPCPKCDLHLSVSRVNHLFTVFFNWNRQLLSDGIWFWFEICYWNI